MPNRAASPGPSQHRVVAMIYDGLCTFEYGIVVEIFGLTRPEMGDDWYSFTTAAVSKGLLRAHGGLQVLAESGLDALDEADTIIVPGWRGIDAPVPIEVLQTLQRAHARGTRLVSLCSGAFVLGATGLLNGRRATTHWRYAEAFKRAFPDITVDPSVLYVDEDPLFTAAGSSAGIDLLLHIIRIDHGPAKANMVAKRLVMAPHRQGGQAQFVDAPVSPTEGSRLAPLLDQIRANLGRDYRISDLAEAAGMSERTFLRRFAEATGATPGEWLVDMRVDVAKQLLEEGRRSIKDVASTAGFGSVETLRHHFRRRVGLSPAAYRERFTRAAATST
jgi:AraC family transcriptional regulator, transcriptional activator FtrA